MNDDESHATISIRQAAYCSCSRTCLALSSAVINTVHMFSSEMQHARIGMCTSPWPHSQCSFCSQCAPCSAAPSGSRSHSQPPQLPARQRTWLHPVASAARLPEPAQKQHGEHIPASDTLISAQLLSALQAMIFTICRESHARWLVGSSLPSLHELLQHQDGWKLHTKNDSEQPEVGVSDCTSPATSSRTTR